MLKRLPVFTLIISICCLTACNHQNQTHTKEFITQTVSATQPENISDTVSRAQAVEVVEKTLSLPGKDEAEAIFYLPEVKGNTGAAALKKINEQLSLQQLTGESVTDIQTTFADCGCGTVGSSYDVNYNRNSILDITVFIETVGAYASGYAKRSTFHIDTGEKLVIDQLLKPESLAKLAAQCDRQLQERIQTTIKETASGEEGEWVKELLQDKKFEVKYLQHFTVSEEGISFYYPFDFPHAALGLEPDNAFHFSFDQLAAYINPGGLLGNL